jgi:predicted nucleic acid-binding Zn ribbon protein
MKKRIPQKLGSIVRSVLSEHGYHALSLEAEIIRKWPCMVGERIAQVTTCNGIRDDVLCVRVASSAWRQELSFLKKQILENVRKNVAGSNLKEIQFL